jgi:hypothetical protein
MVTQTTTQETTNTLPPSARHFEAYRLVKVERKSTRQAAKMLRMSQTRVCQVVARVAGYLVDVTEHEDEARREKQLAVARQVAAEEINYCKDLALRSFDSSRTLRTVRETKDAEGKVTTVTFHREFANESRFLLTIARLGKISSTLPTCTLPIVARRTNEAEADVERGEIKSDNFESGNVDSGNFELGTERDVELVAEPAIALGATAVEPTSEQPAIAQNPSEADCSAQPPEQPFSGFVRPADVEAKVAAFLAYNESQRIQASPKSQESETVHAADSKPSDASPRMTELQRKRRRLDQRKQRSRRKAS